MNVAAITGVRECGVVDVADPQVRRNFVKVRVTVAPMCTEYKAFLAGTVSQRLGHEAAGEVVEVAQPGRVRPGDRVVVMPQSPCGTCWLCLQGEYIHCQNPVDSLSICGCEYGNATYAQYLVKQDWQLIPIPERITDDHASMACCGLGPAFGAMQRAQIGRFDTVLITGMGPVGLGGVVNGKYRGARVIAVEQHPYRKELAARLGADLVIEPDEEVSSKVLDATDGKGADFGIDCTGKPTAQRFLVDGVRRHGTVILVGEGGGFEIQTSDDMIRKGLAIRGSWHWNLHDAPLMMKMISEVGDLLDIQITHTFPMNQVQDAWELQLTGQCGKVLLHPWE